MLTSKALVILYDQLNSEQQHDFIRETYKHQSILTDEEWNMFVEPWIDELSIARLRRIEEMVQILRRYWVSCLIHEKAIWVYVKKDSTGENYCLPKEYTVEQITKSSLHWSGIVTDWQYIVHAFETDFFLEDHRTNMRKIGYEI